MYICIHNVIKDYQEVWIWKKIMALRWSMELQEKNDSSHYKMRDSYEIWIWKKKDGFDMKYGSSWLNQMK